MSINYNQDTVAGFLTQLESYSSIPYLDSAGVPTIGIGTTRYMITNIPVTMNDPPMSYAQAVIELTWYCRGIIAVLNKVITVELNKNQTTSIVAFCYNEGEGNFANSTLCREINANGTDHDIHSAFMMWNKVKDPVTKQLVISKGLVNRRELEYQLYVS